MGIAALRAALLLASVLALFHAAATPDQAAPAYGRERVAEYEVPAELVARWRTQTEGGAGARNAHNGWGDPLQWVGPRQSAGAGRNPYTLVLSIGGVAAAAGDVRTHWQAGWEVEESPEATRDVFMPLAALSSGQVSAGAPLTLTVVGRPVTFRGERQVTPMLNLVRAQNIEVQTVRLALWSGPAPWRLPAAPALLPLALAVLCALGWWALRQQQPRRTASAGRGSAPVPTLPAASNLEAALPMPAPAIEALLAHPVSPRPAPAAHTARVVAALRDVLGSGGMPMQNQADARRGRGPNRGLRTR